MKVDNLPNAGRLIESLRSVGYDNYSAIADLVDNSLDAGATKVHIIVSGERDKVEDITIIDNGNGMDEKVLDQAMRLGSLTEKGSSDLGKFGLGLVTASLSLARSLKVYTTQDKGKTIHYAIQDVDVIKKMNAFVKEQGVLTKAENPFPSGYFNDVDSSTVVKLEKLDRLQGRTRQNDTDSGIGKEVFVNTLVNELGQTFRKFLDSAVGVKIYVNTKEVVPVYPLMDKHPETVIHSEEDYEIVHEGNIQGKIHIRLAILPNFTEAEMRRLKIGANTAGFYILRNNREIARAQLFGFNQPHHYLGRIRIELSFTDELDDLMQINFSKQGVKPVQSILDKLRREVWSEVAKIKTRLVKERTKDEVGDVDHTSAERSITNNWKLLINPPVKKEKRKSPEHKGTEPTQKEEPKNTRQPKEPNTQRGLDGLCEFKHVAMGEAAPLYECEKVGRKIIIEWNTDHPFFQRMVLDHKDNKQIVTGLDYLVYAMASAELLTFNEDNSQFMLTIKSMISSNLRQLLS